MLRQLARANSNISRPCLSTPQRFFATSHTQRQQQSEQSNTLPSSPEMKAGSWTSATSSENSITRKVVGIAKKLSENGKPPIVVDKAFSKQFKTGSIYDPFDFSMSRVDMEKRWEKNNRDAYSNYNGGANDVFEKTGIDPLDLYTMPEILSKFISATGQVLPREVTGCNAKNQRKLGIAVKRAVALGLLSSTNKHARFMPKRIL
ncbi:hypothetical protein JCM33374_g2538 [Metschnikowia sp. JCM 33374]|nr:hypothetical protein JCM33374_g2538 [Metschnikowia sp. JCM 33374]